MERLAGTSTSSIWALAQFKENEKELLSCKAALHTTQHQNQNQYYRY
jgi:hypothetical protein